MDKIKIFKGLVFLMSFGIAFLLCLGTIRLLNKNSNPTYTLNLDVPEGTKISRLSVTDKNLVVETDQNQIRIINIETGSLKGTVTLVRRNKNGEEEKTSD